MIILGSEYNKNVVAYLIISDTKNKKVSWKCILKARCNVRIWNMELWKTRYD